MNKPTKPTPGRLYKHSKTGNLYTVLHVGIYCGVWKAEGSIPGIPQGFPEGTELVVYVGHYDNRDKPGGNRIYIRPVREWSEEVNLKPPHLLGREIKVPRFCAVE